MGVVLHTIALALVLSVCAVPLTFDKLAHARKMLAYTQIKQINEALELYRMTTGVYPSGRVGLEDLTRPFNGQRPFMNTIPLDPWNEPFVYRYPGLRNPERFDLCSLGEDGESDTDDDICNRPPESASRARPREPSPQ